MSEAAARARVEPRDEGHHEHGDEPSWSERLSFTFFDERYSGIVRVESRPRAGTDCAVYLFLPGKGVATVLAKGPDAHAGWNVGRLEMDVVEPLSRWRMRCKDTALLVSDASGSRRGSAAPIELDLEFEAWMRPAGSVERRTEVDERQFVRVVSNGHFEQAGRVAGALRIGGSAVDVDGPAFRDKSWGARDATATHASRMFAIPFGRSLSIAARAVTIGDRTMRSGWVLRDGTIRRITTLRAREEYEGRAVAGVRLEIGDDEGERYSLDGETVSRMQTRQGRTLVTHALTRWRGDGTQTLGLSEYLGE